MTEILEKQRSQRQRSRWSDTLGLPVAARPGAVAYGSCLVESLTVQLPCTAAQAYKPIQRIGGQTGWYYANWLWRLRGWLDLLVGGVGLRRGRRDAEEIVVGDRVDCWQVEAMLPNRLLRLLSEMRMPGRGWLQFEVIADELSATIRVTAVFDPAGALGLIYWYALYPIHRALFAGMLRGIVRAIDGIRVQGETEVGQG